MNPERTAPLAPPEKITTPESTDSIAAAEVEGVAPVSGVPVIIQGAGGLATESATYWQQGDEERARHFITDSSVRNSVGRVLRKYGHPDPDVLMSETVIRLARARGLSLDQDSHGYAYRVAERLAIDSFRAQRARPDTVELDETKEWRPQLIAPDFAQRVEQRHVLRELLACLSDKQKEVIIAIFFEGMSNEEVAAKLGIALVTVKNHLHLARRRMKRYASENNLTLY